MASTFKNVENFTENQKKQKRKETNNWCELCQIHRIDEFHHKNPKENKGTKDYDNMAGLCIPCHAWADKMFKNGYTDFTKLVQLGGPYWIGAKLMFAQLKGFSKFIETIENKDKDEDINYMFQLSESNSSIINNIQASIIQKENIEQKEIEQKEELSKPLEECEKLHNYELDILNKLSKKEFLEFTARQFFNGIILPTLYPNKNLLDLPIVTEKLNKENKK